MWLEDFTPSESQEGSKSSREAAEKYRQSVKKRASWLKKISKDEKKARKHDLLLLEFLTEIIRNKKYDIILNDLFKALDSSKTSNFIIWILSLIYLPISNKIRTLNNLENISFDKKPYSEEFVFDDNNLDLEFKNRINLWIEDIIYILKYDYSSVQIKSLLESIKKEDIDYENIIKFVSKIFQFFFKEFNIYISEEKAYSYSSFIVKEIYNKIKDIEIENI